MALLISNQDVAQVLDIKICLDAIEEGIKEYYRGDATCRPRIDVWAPSATSQGYYQWGSMEGTSRRYGVFATRIKSDIAYWSEGENGVRTQEKYCQRPGLFCGLILLFSTENGEPLAVINDGYLQHLRVGATAGIAAKYLAREDADTVGMIGSGSMACTDSVVPVIPGRAIEVGAFVCTVKGSVELDKSSVERIRTFYTFAPNNDALGQQGDAPVSAAQKISGTHRAYVAGQPEDLARIPEIQREGTFDRQKLLKFKNLFDGKAPGRVDAEEILGVGGNNIQGIQFASVGGATYRLIREKGLGREFPTDWLLQDVRN